VIFASFHHRKEEDIFTILSFRLCKSDEVKSVGSGSILLFDVGLLFLLGLLAAGRHGYALVLIG